MADCTSTTRDSKHKESPTRGTMNKLGILGATAALLSVPVLGISYAAAQDGADDPTGHVRHSGTDDSATHETRHRARGTDDRVVLKRAKIHDHGRRHGGDDDHRGRRGGDDG